MKKIVLLAMALVACGRSVGIPDGGSEISLETTVSPPPGSFYGEVTLTFTTSVPAIVYLSTNGKDPRETTEGRMSGQSPLTVTLSATSTVKYFASLSGRDEDLHEGEWVRAGAAAGTISGVIVTGSFVSGRPVALLSNGTQTIVGTPSAPGELPFELTGLTTGRYRLRAMADLDQNGQFNPFTDYQSDPTTVELDLADPLKASVENVRIYLAASGSGLGTLRGTVSLPMPPEFQSLRISVLSPDSFSAGFDATALLGQLQNGYGIITNQDSSEYPYVIADITPGQYLPVPALFGFSNGGIALNLLANPIDPVQVNADEETEASFSFGSVTMTGLVTLGPASSPSGFAYGVVAARAISFTEGIQALIMPTLFFPDGQTGNLTGAFSGASLRSDTSFQIRVFTNANGASPATDALSWLLNPFATAPPDATVMTNTSSVVQDIALP